MKILSAVGNVAPAIGNTINGAYSCTLSHHSNVNWEKVMDEFKPMDEFKSESKGYIKQYVFRKDENEIKKTHDENGKLIKDDANKFVDGLTQRVSPVFDDNPSLGTEGRDR